MPAKAAGGPKRRARAPSSTDRARSPNRANPSNLRPRRTALEFDALTGAAPAKEQAPQARKLLTKKKGGGGQPVSLGVMTGSIQGLTGYHMNPKELFFLIGQLGTGYKVAFSI